MGRESDRRKKKGEGGEEKKEREGTRKQKGDRGEERIQNRRRGGRGE